jgi:hypothetical protein
MRAFARLVLLSLVATVFSLHAYAQCPGTMAIVGPADGQNVPLNASNTVTVKWVAVAGATSYDVYFGTPGQGCAASPRATVTTTEFSPPSNELSRGGTYEWRVKANTTACRETACATFTIAACPSTGPTLNSPADGNQVSFGAVTLDWNDVPNASLYELFVGIDGDALSPIGTTTLTQKTLSFEPGRSIRWNVVAHSTGCTGVPSAISTFTTSCPTGAPSLRTPDNGDQVTGGTPINFSWTALAGATSYDLEGSAAGQNQWLLLGENIAATAATKIVPEGAWNWRVRANFDSSCTPAYSEIRSFSVGPSCANSAPEQIDPSPAEKLKSPVTFRWSDVAASEYRLFLQGTGDPAPVLLTTTSRTEHVATLDPDLYSWTVIAKFASCPDRAAGGRQFEVEADDDGCPSSPGEATLLTPAANATGLTSPVTFTWQAVNKATGYRVLASFDDDPVVSLGVTTGTSLTTAVPSGPGYWIVQTLFGDECPTSLSDRRTFTVSSGAVCGNTAPHAISPANGATNVDSPVTFVWGSVAGAVSYRLFVAPGDDDFSFYGETEETTLTRFVPAGSAKWFVTAQFAACAATKSAENAFVVSDGGCANATIELKSPSDGSTSSSPVRMSWSSTGIGPSESYRVWVAVDDDAPVVIARTTALEALVSLPSGDFTWYVDVPRTNCESVVSDQGHFKVAKNTNCSANTAPLLTSPVGTEQAPAQATSPTNLVWGAVPNAIGYRVWISEKGQAFEDVDLTRETHQTIDLDPGTYRWFVQALFEGCEPVASAIAFFRIAETTPRCPTEAATILEPAANAVVSSPVTISWTGVGEATKYRVFVSRDGEAAILLGATTETSIERALPPGQYLVAIESLLDECPSTFSERRTFSVAESQNCTDEATTLVAPANQSTVSTEPVEFVWQPLSGAVKYVVFAQLGEGSPTAIGATDDTHLSRLVPPGAIEWWVLTFFSGCDPTESAHFTFEMTRPADCNNARPILLLPADESRPIFSPITFAWTAVPNATGYNVWLAHGENDFSIVSSTTAPEAEAELEQGFYKWYVQATFANCRPRESAVGEFSVRAPIACTRPEKPDAQVVGQAQSDTRYKVRWTPLANVGLYELQEATNLEFNDAETFTVSDTFHQFSHAVTGAPVQYLYRVRGVSDCISQSQSSDQRGPYSDVVGVFIIQPKTNNASAEVGAQDKVVQTVFLPGSPTPVKYSATSDKPWITITPASGNLPPEGITLTITANPAAIQLGTNTGTIYVAYDAAASGRIQTNGTTLSVPVSVSLVTPVTPTGSSSPPPDSLIFPVVGHATGANDSLFESDIRVTNLTAQTMKYQVKFTPSGTDGTQTGSSTTVQIEPNQTLAIDDIVSSLFGVGTIGSATGMLEVRPLTTSTSSTGGIFTSVVPGAIKELTTAAASRTYNFTPTGTFGQFIPAIRFDEFVGKAATGTPAAILSLQQVAQSDAYRANFGFAEGSGQPADLSVRVYDTAGTLLKTIPVSLQAGEHKQLNGMLSANGITTLENGRVEVEVTGGTGKVTAYVSEVDNRTNDPLLVSSVLKGTSTANRYVVPGVAYASGGAAFWVTDLRIYNAGAATPATLTYYPWGNPTGAVTRDVTLDAGEIEVIDNVLGELFQQPSGAGGSIAITTPANTQLTATARTYNQTSNGTYGQYIPGVTVAQSVGVNDRALQLLQLEQSSRFRTNIGLNETSGQPVRVEVTLIVPDSIVSPVVAFDLKANEFQQFSLASFGLGSAVYNARVTVKATSGTGRVTAYGSAIDEITQDPTYVPAQ